MLKTMLFFLVAALGLSAAAFVLIGRERIWMMVAGTPDRGQYDFSLASRSLTPNDALACTEGLCEKPDFVIAARQGQPDLVLNDVIGDFLAGDPLARRLDTGSDPLRARFVTYSPLMRFPDLVSLEAVALPDGMTGLMAYVRAQLGSSDMGKNRERLERLFAD